MSLFDAYLLVKVTKETTIIDALFMLELTDQSVMLRKK